VPLCGTYCKLTLGAVATGVAVVGGEVAKDGIIVGAAAAGGSTGMSAAGVAGGAVAGNIAMHEVADHVKPPNAPTDPAQPASSEQPTNSADTANGATTQTTDQPAPTQGEVKGDLTRLQKEASAKSAGNRVGAKGELDAIERLTKEGKNVDKLPDRGVQGQKEPDFRVDGELYEIKTREEPLDDRWLKDRIRDANKQFKGSNYENPRGSVELQLKNQVESDTQLLERAERQVRGQFKHDRSEHVTDVRVYNDGRLIGKWSRTGDKVVRTFPIAEQ